MKKWKWTVLFAVTVLGASCATPAPRNDGLYYCQGKRMTMYLRFFEDGRVISANLPGKFYDMTRWFNTAYTENTGHYHFDGKKLTFTTGAEEGTVEYSGSVGSKNMTLTLKSLINGHTEESVNYKFESFAGEYR